MCVTAALALLTAGASGAPQPNARVDWDSLDPADVFPGELLVGFKSTAPQGGRMRAAFDLNAANALHAAVGANVRHTFRTFPTQHVKLPDGVTLKDVAAVYEAQANVAYVEPNYRNRHLCVEPNDPRFGELWGMQRINAPDAWDRTTGSDEIVVGVVDTGIRYTHEDLAANMWRNPGEDWNGQTPGNNGIDDDGNGYVDDYYGWDFADNDNDPIDSESHGTHVAGTIGGVGDNGVGVAGVNWTVKLAAIRIFGSGGYAGDARTAEAIEYCAAIPNCKVTNHSWGGFGGGATLANAIQSTEAAGQLFVAAAGNNGLDIDFLPFYPASYDIPNVVSVAALAPGGGLAGFSNYGQQNVDLGAPGQQILSSVSGSDSAYSFFAGTSMASPHVAGAAALLWSEVPSSGYETIRRAIFDGVEPNEGLDGRSVTGGELDVASAMLAVGARIELDRLAYRSDAIVGVTVWEPQATGGVNEVSIPWRTTTNGMDAIRAQGVLTAPRDGTTTAFPGYLQLTSGVSAVHGDLLRVSYVDTVGVTNRANAPIDDVPPLITDLEVAEVWDDTATIVWYTDEPADSHLRIATTLPLDGVTPIGTDEYVTDPVVGGGGARYLHGITITNLLPLQRYFVAVQSLDYAGNTGAVPVDVTSTNIPDYLIAVTRPRRLVYEDNLDTGPGEWTTSSLFPEGCWEYGRPVVGPFGAYSGSNCWGTVLTGRYPEDENAWVESEPFHVKERPRLSFWTWYELVYTEDFFGEGYLDIDLGFVEVNDGSGWRNVTGRAQGVRPIAAARGTGFSGFSYGWQRVSIDLPDYGNEQIRVRFRLDSNNPRLRAVNSAAGWYVDDVAVTHFFPQGIELVGYAVDDVAGGDGDGVPEAGETFALDLEFLNTDGKSTYTGVQGAIDAPDSGVTLTGGEIVNIAYGTVGPGDRTYSGYVPEVSVASWVDRATLFHNMTAANGGPWAEELVLEIERRETIRGTVTALAGGSPIEDAVLSGTASGLPTLSAVTDAAGDYALNGCVPDVTYSIVAGKPGFFSESDPLAREAPDVGVDFALGQAFAAPDPTGLVFRVFQEELGVTNLLLNNGAGNVDLKYTASSEYPGWPEDWITVEPSAGTVPVGAASNLVVSVSSSNLSSGTYLGIVEIGGNDVSGDIVEVPVTMIVTGTPVLYLADVNVLGGDGDIYAEPGETVDLDIVIGNRGDEIAFGVGGTLRALTNLVTVTEPAASWPFIFPFWEASPSNFPSVTVHALPANTVLPFVVDVTNDQGRLWSFPFELTVDVRYSVSGRVTPCTNAAMPLAGALVRAEGSSMTAEALTGTNGQYVITGLIPGPYEFVVSPPAPYSSPASRVVNVTDDRVDEDFCVYAWGLTVDPTSITRQVDEGQETNATLTISNIGTNTGHVEVRVDLVSGIPERQLGLPPLPTVSWNSLPDGTYMPNQMLIRFKDGVAPSARQQTLASAGARQLRAFSLVPSALVSFEGTATAQSVAAQLAADPNVLYVTPNYVYRPTKTPDDRFFDEMSNLLNLRQTFGTWRADVNATQAWDVTVGSADVVVGIVDTGIELSHPDLIDNLWRNLGEDWTTNGLPATNGIDDDGNGYIDDNYGWDTGWDDNDPNPDYDFGFAEGADHGTHVAGTVGAVGNNDRGVVGVNWNVRLMPVKATTNMFDFFGLQPVFPVSAVVGAIEYMITNNVPISNHSYGGPVFSPLHWEYVGKAMEAGHLMICAAGNDGQDNDLYDAYPAGYGRDDGGWPNIIAVAATDEDDVLASFSNFGDESVDIAAPGVDVLSTVAYFDFFGPDLGYDWKSGTSMAAPHVAGVCALAKAFSPAATWDMLKIAVLDGARRNSILDGRIDEARQLDAAGALEVLRTFWITVNPDSADIPGGGSVEIDVGLNVGGHLPNGLYEADIVVSRGVQVTNVPVSLFVNPAPFPSLVSVSVDDAAPDGDEDAVAEPGETVDLVIRLLNEGSDDLINPAGVLSTVATGVAVSNQPAWGFIFSQQEADSVTPATVTFDSGVTSPVPFSLEISDALQRKWQLAFDLTVAPRHSIRGAVLDVQSGLGVSNAAVEYWGTSGGRVTADADGNYGIHGLLDGTYRVRALPDTHEKAGPVTAVIASGDATNVDFTVGQTVAGPATNLLSVPLLLDQVTSNAVTVSNSSPDTFEFTILEMPRRQIALISDGSQLSVLEPVLEDMGFDVTVYNNNFDYVTYFAYGTIPVAVYSDDPAVVFNYDLVIADVSGRQGGGRQITYYESEVYTEYLDRGGKIIFTGVNPLSFPDDGELSWLTDVTSVDRSAQGSGLARVASLLPNSTYVDLAVGENLAVRRMAYDLATPGDESVAYVTAGSATKLLRRTPADGGRVYLWTGNLDGEEWTQRGVWQDVLKNLLIDEFQRDVEWLSVTPDSGSLTADALDLTVTTDADGLETRLHQATLLIKGNYPGSENTYIHVDLDVLVPTLRAKSVSGVTNWMGNPLPGDGGVGSSVFQLIWAGPDGRIDSPDRGGGTRGDDSILRTYPENRDVGFFGVGFPLFPDTGVFSDVFRHRLSAATADRHVYVRAWDGATVGSAVAYGDSLLYGVVLQVNEAHDFGSWRVDQAPGYPAASGKSPDTNGDSVPDGWYIHLGLDPRDPIAALTSGVTAEWVFGENGPGALAEPRKLFRAGDLVIVLDKGNNAVKVWNENTRQYVTSFANGFSQPEGLGRDPNANRFAVADTLNDRIQVLTFDPVTGAIAHERTFGSNGSGNGQMWNPKGVAIGPLGLIYVVDTLNDRIQAFDGTGNYLYQFGSSGAGYGDFNRPEGIAVDAKRHIYVADTRNHRIQMFTGSGGDLGMEQFGSATQDPFDPQPGEFWYPKDVQIGLNNRIVVADTGNHRVQMFDGSSIWAAPHLLTIGEAGEVTVPYGVWPVAQSRYLYVADASPSRVLKFDVALDADGDGMDDTWEVLNGLDPSDPDDWDDDPDGDGVWNIGEFRIGTDPWNPDSDDDDWTDGFEIAGGYDPLDPQWYLLRITQIAALPNFTVRYTGAAGVTYKVQSSFDLVVGTWADEPGSTVTPGTDGVVEFVDISPLAPEKFYRVVRVSP